MSDAHKITPTQIFTSDQGIRYAFECSVAGRRMMSKELYATDKGAVRACKRWISKHGVKP